MTSNKSSEVLAAWEESSHYWNKHQALIEQIFTPLTRALIDDAKIVADQSVLDIGGGAGEPSLSIAQVVGNSGSVIYTDPAAGMVRAARTEAEKRELRKIQFHQCAAENLPFPHNTFDVAVGRLSAMFFANPLAGLAEILRVVKRGGRVSFLVWAARELNPFFTIVTEVLDRFVPPEPEDEDAPGAFRFAKPGKLANLLRDAGATDVSEQPLVFTIKAPITVTQFYELRTEMSDTFRAKLAKLTTEQAAAVREGVIQAATAYFKDGGMNFPSQALIVTGIKK